MIKPDVKIDHLQNEGILRITMDIQLENITDHMLKEINWYLTQNDFKEQCRPLYDLLSEREKEILQLVLQRYTSIQIAGRLHIAYNTVRTHRKNIMQKLECTALKELMKYKDFQ